MTRSTRGRLALRAGSAAVVALLLAACTASTGATPGADDAPEPWAWVYGPLDDFLVRIGRSWRPPEDRDESLELTIAQSIEIDELVAACMAEQGFTYLPAIPVGRPPAQADENLPRGAPGSSPRGGASASARGTR